MGIQRLRCSATDSGISWQELEMKRNRKNLRETGLLNRLTGSGRPHTTRSCDISAVYELAQSQASKLHKHSSTKWTFWTYFVTINLIFFLCTWTLFHTMLDAAGVVLRVHYESMKYDVSFSQGSVSMIFKWGGHIFMHVIKNFSCLQQCKNYKNWSRFSNHKCTATFLHGSQCIYIPTQTHKHL